MLLEGVLIVVLGLFSQSKNLEVKLISEKVNEVQFHTHTPTNIDYVLEKESILLYTPV